MESRRKRRCSLHFRATNIQIGSARNSIYSGWDRFFCSAEGSVRAHFLYLYFVTAGLHKHTNNSLENTHRPKAKGTTVWYFICYKTKGRFTCCSITPTRSVSTYRWPFFLHFLLPNFKASSGMAPFSNAFDHAADISFKFPAFFKFFFFNLWREILGNFFESGGAFQSGRVD